jgi:hypothetical protein
VPRRGAVDAVDRPAIEPSLVQRDLDRREPSVAGGLGGEAATASTTTKL